MFGVAPTWVAIMELAMSEDRVSFNVVGFSRSSEWSVFISKYITALEVYEKVSESPMRWQGTHEWL